MPWEDLMRSLGEDVEGLRGGAIAASGRAGAAHRKTASLELRLARQELLLEALVRGILDRGVMTPVELGDLIGQVDLEDGAEDGRIGPDRVRKAPKCPTCEKPISRKREHCVYCGDVIPEELKKARRRGYRR